MELILALLVGVLFAGGVYMMLRRSMVKLIIGLILLGQAANMLIFTIGGLERETPPLIQTGSEALTGAFADPLPQALILTAIVIGFGAQAFAIVLIRRVFQVTQTDDLDQLIETEK